jgi:DNA-binding NarL/FixJ family response regulator
MSEGSAASGPSRIGIVEDHLRYREALEATIATMAGVSVAWIVECSADAQAKIDEIPVDLMIVDLSIPGGSGIELIERLSVTSPDTVFVVVSGHTERQYVDRSFEAGAIAYVVKGRPSDLRDGIAAGRERRRYLSPQLRSAHTPSGAPAD